MTFKVQTARRCRKCDKPLRSWNKTGLCSICYERDYKRSYSFRSQKKQERNLGLAKLDSANRHNKVGSSDIHIQRKKIEHDINFGIDYANPVRVWKGIRKLLKLKEKERILNNATRKVKELRKKVNKGELSLSKYENMFERTKPRRRRIKR